MRRLRLFGLLVTSALFIFFQYSSSDAYSQTESCPWIPSGIGFCVPFLSPGGDIVGFSCTWEYRPGNPPCDPTY